AIYIFNITQKSNKEQAINQKLCEDKRFNCPEFFYLKNVQKRLTIYGISSSHLRKISSEHAITIYRGKNDVYHKCLCQLALRHKVVTLWLDDSNSDPDSDMDEDLDVINTSHKKEAKLLIPFPSEKSLNNLDAIASSHCDCEASLE
ncbi:10663_t:CDS:2, partial [Dentiscutata heterogama]